MNVSRHVVVAGRLRRGVFACFVAMCLVLAGCTGGSPQDATRESDPAKNDPSQEETPDALSKSPSEKKGVTAITFDDIAFEMEKTEPFQRSMLTERIEALHDNEVRIGGYILPSFRQKGITQFVLVRDNMECCFGPGAALYDCIFVEMEGDRSISYTVRPVHVEGTFSIREYQGPDGKHLAVFHLLGRKVK